MRITANQVTIARIFLLPVPVYMLIYGQQLHWWIAFFLFIFLGATDFVDGWMARREGPTKFGALIDPVADKIFLASVLLSLLAMDLFPPWVISALLTREFLVTALRSSVAARKESVKTSRLAKLKTIIQMGGCGTIFLTIILPEQALIFSCLGLAIPFLAVFFVHAFLKKKPPFWALPVGLAFILVAVIEYFFYKDVTLMVQILIIVGITWVSALDYVSGCFRLFRRTGMMLGDWVRVFWALVFGLLLPPLVGFFPVTVLPVLASLSLEFALGGIDNVVVAEKHQFKLWPFLVSSSAGILFMIIMNLAIAWPFLPVFYISLGLCLASFLVCSIFFGKNFALFKQSLSS